MHNKSPRYPILCVITSYSIHYTKLYEHALALPSTEQVKDGSVSEANYLLIAGSFKNNRNAELLRDQLIRKGFKAEVRETGINFRVIIGQFADRQQAIQELRRMRSQLDQSVWLLEENLK